MACIKVVQHATTKIIYFQSVFFLNGGFYGGKCRNFPRCHGLYSQRAKNAREIVEISQINMRIIGFSVPPEGKGQNFPNGHSRGMETFC